MHREKGTPNTPQIIIEEIIRKHAEGKSVHELLLHSDQGFQYTSGAYNNPTKSYGITPSML